MLSLTRREIVTVIVGVIVFLVAMTPSLLYARHERRDGMRRDEIAALKVRLEQYYNQHEAYPLVFETGPHQYVVTEQNEKGAVAWYLRAQLENQADPITGFDFEAGRNYYFRIVNEDSKTFYDVCGGTATCGATKL